MKILKTILCAALLVAGLCGCEKIDVNKLEGTWTEQYDPTVFAMDGSVEYWKEVGRKFIRKECRMQGW